MKKQELSKDELIINNLECFLFRNEGDQKKFIINILTPHYDLLYKSIYVYENIGSVFMICKEFMNIDQKDMVFRPKEYKYLDDYFFKEAGE